MPSTEIRLRKSGGGVFEITVDGKLAYLPCDHIFQPIVTPEDFVLYNERRGAKNPEPAY